MEYLKSLSRNNKKSHHKLYEQVGVIHQFNDTYQNTIKENQYQLNLIKSL